MQLSSKIFPVIVFLLVAAASLTLLIFPELVYEILIWVIKSFQAGGLPLLFLMMIIQALAIPIPSELVLIAGGLAFGLLFGWLVGALGSIIAALVGFGISRWGGRSLAIRIVGEKGIKFADNWFNRWGAWAVLLGRFAPFIPFDAISYSAGLTKMKLRDFMLPTVIGTFPRAFFYAFLGGFFGVTFDDLIKHYEEFGEIPAELQGALSTFNLVLLAAVAVMVAILIVYWFVTRRYTAEMETKSI
uniref:VTT domain-containing protein n=1 Tax=uncultured miscellaneous Crenarchaeota group TaxID=1368239 RepID=W8RW54_9ARCH|nr:hypothetical protein Rxyl_2829 [uncultured miscellaneous Crenarchaeota group]